nr:vegetative cell wall protein gp1-like [Aegilops tauschii subsp. strangulata]
MADPTSPPPPLLALHLQPPTRSAPRQDPENALAIPLAVPPTTPPVPAPPARRTPRQTTPPARRKPWSFHTCTAERANPHSHPQLGRGVAASYHAVQGPGPPRRPSPARGLPRDGTNPAGPDQKRIWI